MTGGLHLKPGGIIIKINRIIHQIQFTPLPRDISERDQIMTREDFLIPGLQVRGFVSAFRQALCP
jgi:hypothetical protein